VRVQIEHARQDRRGIVQLDDPRAGKIGPARSGADREKPAVPDHNARIAPTGVRDVIEKPAAADNDNLLPGVSSLIGRSLRAAERS
jgi:hypothetical protein